MLQNHTKLHISQTGDLWGFIKKRFRIIQKLHISQTLNLNSPEETVF